MHAMNVIVHIAWLEINVCTWFMYIAAARDPARDYWCANCRIATQPTQPRLKIFTGHTFMVSKNGFMMYSGTTDCMPCYTVKIDETSTCNLVLKQFLC